MKSLYYICHPFNSIEWVRKWQLKMQRKLNIKMTNAFFSRYKPHTEVWKKGDVSEDKVYKKLDAKAIVERDIELLSRQKIGAIVIVDGEISYGTIQEMVYAKLLGLKVLLLATNGHHNHPWLKYHADKTFTKLIKLEEYLEKCHT